VAAIASKKRRPVLNRRGCDQDVGVRDASAVGAKSTTNLRKTTHGRPIEGEHVDGAEKLSEATFVALCIVAVIDPVVDFAVRDDGDCEAILGGQARQDLDSIPLALEPVRDPVGIDEERHSSMGGRVEIRRLSAFSRLNCSTSTSLQLPADDKNAS